MASKAIKDYYALLGVSQNATQEQIRLAFRQMARTYHPDINDAPDAEERFREINEAYEILADPEKRKSYDFFTVSLDNTESNSTPPTQSESTVTETPPETPAASPPATKRPGPQRIYPPTWAILLIVLGACIIVSVGVGAVLSLQRNRPTGGAESADVTKLTTFLSPPKIPADLTVVQEGGTPILTVLPNQLDVAGTAFSIVPVTPEQGRWPIPQEQQATAVWIYGTVINYVVGVPYVTATESLLAGLESSDRITLTLDNGTALVFGAPQAQRIAAEDLSPMAQDKPGLTLVVLGNNQTNRLTVQARYLPEESVFSDEQRVDGLEIQVLKSSIPSKVDDMLYFVVDYQVTNNSGASSDPMFFDMTLEDGNGQRYMLNETATSQGEYGPLTQAIPDGETATGSAGYLVPRDIAPPATWVFRSDATSVNSVRFVLPYEPPKLGPPVPDVVLSEVFNDATRAVIVINGTIYNNGETNLVVTLDDVNLTSGNGNGALQASTPLLPWTVAPGDGQGFEMQFSRPPDVDSVLLEMLGFTYRIEGIQP